MNDTPSAIRRIALPLACVLPLTLAACGGGGGGDDDDSAADRGRTNDAAVADEGRDQGRDDSADLADPSATETAPPTFLLTGELDVADGWTEVPARCSSSEPVGPPYFSYHVPDDWEHNGGGAAGSGGIGGSGDHRYTLPSGMAVTVDVATDDYEAGELLDSQREPWTSWDYEITYYGSSGERTYEVVYDELDPVTIDGETFDLWGLEASDDDVDATWSSEYKLRAEFAEVPDFTGSRRPESAAVTISWSNRDGADLDEEVARSLLETFRLPDCAQDEITEMYEMLTGSNWSDED